MSASVVPSSLSTRRLTVKIQTREWSEISGWRPNEDVHQVSTRLWNKDGNDPLGVTGFVMGPSPIKNRILELMEIPYTERPSVALIISESNTWKLCVDGVVENDEDGASK